jgi:hypothetical protein
MVCQLPFALKLCLNGLQNAALFFAITFKLLYNKRDMPEPEKRIVMGRGEVSESQQQLAIEALNQLGFVAETVDPERYDEFRQLLVPAGTPGYYTFEEISSEEQYLGKEHLHGFHTRHADHLAPRLVTIAFQNLVQPRTKYKGGVGERIAPETVGLIVKKRAEVGFAPLNGAFNRSLLDSEILDSVVQVGSAINFISSLRDPAVEDRIARLGRKNSTQMQFLNLLAAQLVEQIRSGKDQ